MQVDETTGVEERIEQLAGPNGLLYTWAARPPGSTSGVIICSSVLGDFVANYHRERLLGLQLAARGHCVFRFHYAGEGNSFGDRELMTFETMSADADAVTEFALGFALERLAVVGTRVGALVAGSLVRRHPPMPLALWEPVSNAARFLQEAGRARRMSQLARESDAAGSSWREELATKGVLDVLGYDIHAGFVTSLEGVDLVDLLDEKPTRIFVGRFGGQPDRADPLADRLRQAGHNVTRAASSSLPAWWMDSEAVDESSDLIGATCDWLDQEVGRE
jgi:hypothetical protein